MKTTQFLVTIGVNPGYGHLNEQQADIVAPLWQEVAGWVFAELNIYVGGAVTTGKTVYHTSWGCPSGGEETATIIGLRNPEFCHDDGQWRAAVIDVVERVRDKLGQKTAYVVFSEADFHYLVAK